MTVRNSFIAGSVALVLALGALASPAFAAKRTNVIQRIDVSEKTARTEITVVATTRPTFTVFKLDKPTRLFIDIVDADLSKLPPRTPVRNGVIADIAVGTPTRAGAALGRIEIAFDRDASYDIETRGNKLVVMIAGDGRDRPDLKLAAAKAEAARIARAVARERKLLKQLRAARQAEEKLKTKAATERAQQEILMRRVAAARRQAERLNLQAQTELDRITTDLEALSKKKRLANDKVAALARAVKAEQERKAAAQAERKKADQLRAAVNKAMATERARLAAVKAATERAKAERAAALEAAKAAKAHQEAQAKLAAAKARGASKKLRGLQRDLERRERALSKANKQLASRRASVQEARLAEAQASAALVAAQKKRESLESEKRQLADKRLSKMRARVTALEQALARKIKLQSSAANERAQRDLAELEQRLVAQREAVKAAKKKTEIEQARIAMLQSQLDNERNELAKLRKLRKAEEKRVAELRQEAKRYQAEADAAQQRAAKYAKEIEAQRISNKAKNVADAKIAELKAKLAAEKRAADKAKRAAAAAERQRVAAEAERQQAERDKKLAEKERRRAEKDRLAADKQRKAEERARLSEARQREQAEKRRLADEAKKRAVLERRLKALAAKRDAAAKKQLAALQADKADAERRLAAAKAQRQALAVKAREEAKARAAAEARARRASAAVAAAKNRKPAERANVRDVTFKDIANGGQVIIALDKGAPYKVVRHSKNRIELKLFGATLPKALERSLDASEFDGPVKLISSFRSKREPGVTRVVIDLRDDATHDLKTEGNRVVWAFTKRVGAPVGPAAQPKPNRAVAKAPRMPPVRTKRQRPGRRMPPGVTAYPGGVGAEAGSTPAAVGTGRFIGNRRGNARRGGRRYRGKRINVTIKDADIRNVLTFLAKEGGVNIVASDKVGGKVTFHLENVPWDLALDMILKTQGYDYVLEAGVYRVAPAKDIRAEFEAEVKKKEALRELKPLVVRFISVNYANLKDLEKHIKGVLSKFGSVTIDQATSTVLVKDVEEHVQAAEEIARRLDVQLPQVLIEARVVEATTSFSSEFGIQWGGDFAMAPAFGNPTGLAFPSIIGLSGGADDAAAPIEGLLTSNPNFAVNLPAAVGAGAGGALGLTLGSIGGAANLNLRLSAAEERGQVKIVSAPKILTLDGNKATIQQGVDIPVPVVSANGVNTQFFEASLKLDVLTNTSPDGNIRLDLKIQKNEPDFGQTSANGAPTIQKKEAETSLLVCDGETTVIGGIYTRNSGFNESGVPVLSKIPILGWFFKNHTERDNRSELLIFITPRVLNRRASVVGQGQFTTGTRVDEGAQP